MKYVYTGEFVEGIFLNRPNRFIAEVKLGDEEVIAHVKNTGRMKEILIPGKKVYLQKALNPNRKTKYDLISIEHGDRFINLDSQIPNKVIADAFLNNEIRGYENIDFLKREVTFQSSRLDMLVEKDNKKTYVEVKGVDLIKHNGHAMFPDAVTDRGIRHLRELRDLVELGHGAMVIFMIARDDAVDFRPHYEMDFKFSETFYEVIEKGVEARAYTTNVGYNYIELKKEVPILSKKEAFMSY